MTKNERKRFLDSVNLVLFSKTVSNKFITVQDVVFIILLYCNSIPEFVASRYARFRVQKSIENARKRFLEAENSLLFSKTISKKFTTVYSIVSNMLLPYNSIPEFIASNRLGLECKNHPKTQENVFWTL